MRRILANSNKRRVTTGRRSIFARFGRTPISVLTVLVCLAVVSCALEPPKVTPSLEPAPDANVWPLPPEQARYALAGVLIGERNFLAPGQETATTARSALGWLAGLVIGEPEYVELRRPVSGLTEKSGRVLVVDASHRAVVVFDMAGKSLALWSSIDRGERFRSPVGIAGDGAGGYLVTDSELGEVIRLAADGTPQGRFGGKILSRPTGIARDDMTGFIYVADTARHDIKVFDSNGTLVDILGGKGDTPGSFNAPTHLLFHDGRLYVVDTLNFRVQVFDRDGKGLLSFGALGLFVGNMTRPKGVAVGGDGRIYVVESYYDYLLVFDADGQLLLPIGGTGPDVGKFYLPAGIWTDAQGRVYVADMFNGRVVVFKELTGVRGT